MPSSKLHDLKFSIRHLRNRIKIFCCCSFVAVNFTLATLNAETITSADVAERSISTDCLDWRISGVCIWLKCNLFGCYTVTSPKITHRLPDLIVSAYPETFQSPLKEMKMIFETISNSKNSSLSGGSISGISNILRTNDALKFFEVDVIGNPNIAILKENKFLCRSTTKPMYPYFLSILDETAWRSGYPDNEKYEAITPGVREIGDWPNFTWGSVYPRSGFVIQSSSGKAAAVTSQRAIDILFNDGTGHVVQDIKRSGNYEIIRGDTSASNETTCKLSGGRWEVNPKFQETGMCRQQEHYQWLSESDENKDRWQMIYPNPNRKCLAFGENEHWEFGPLSTDERFIWLYWREYSCCVKRGGKLLKKIDFKSN